MRLTFSSLAAMLVLALLVSDRVAAAPPDSSSVVGIAWSPTGASLAVCKMLPSGHTRLARFDRGSGVTTDLTPPDDYSIPSWDSQGQFLLTSRTGGDGATYVCAISAASGAIVFEDSHPNRFAPAFGPERALSHVIATARIGDSLQSIVSIDLLAGTERVIVGQSGGNVFPLGCPNRLAVFADFDPAGFLQVRAAMPDALVFQRTDLNTPAGPFAVTVSDLNGDSSPDLAVADYSAAQVSILMNDGQGQLGAPTNYPSGLNPTSVAIGDLNGDLVMDLVSASWSSSLVSVYPGLGGGVLGARADLASGFRSISSWLVDLNADAVLDLVVAIRSAGRIEVRLGDGAGGFGPRTSFLAGAFPYSIASGDLDHDGDVDLVVGHDASGFVSVLLGNGVGGFSAPTNVSAGATTRSVALGDLDHDTNLDLVVVDMAANVVSVMLGNGAGGLGTKVDFATGAGPAWVAIGDLNGDANLDLAVADQTGNAVSMLYGDGAGGLSSHQDIAVGSTPSGVAIADLDADGNNDVVVANLGSGTVSILRRIVQPVLVQLSSCDSCHVGPIDVDLASGRILMLPEVETQDSVYFQVGYIDPDGQSHQLTLDPVDHADPAWTADGTHVTYMRSDADGVNIYWSALAGGGEVALTTGPGIRRAGRLSPSNSTLAYLELVGTAPALVWDLAFRDLPSVGVPPAAGRSPLSLSVGANPWQSGDALPIRFALPQPGAAVLDVYDARGAFVRNLFRGSAPAGTRSISWDARDRASRDVPSGLYFLRLRSAVGVRTTKVVLMR